MHEAAAPKAVPQVTLPKPQLSLIQGGKSTGNNPSNKSKPGAVPVAKTNEDDNNKKNILYHYTDQKGFVGILNSSVILPSLKAVRPTDARYGDGQYLTDIAPNSMSPQELSKTMYNNIKQTDKVAYYIAIDVTGLVVKKGRDHVFVVPNEKPLSILNRLIRAGQTYPQNE